MNRNLLVLALLVGLSASSSVWSEELPSELRMKTDVGEVVIQTAECPIKNTFGFEYGAFATDNTVVVTGKPEVHLGCWKKDGGLVQIWFYNEPEPPVASYKDFLFTK